MTNNYYAVKYKLFAIKDGESTLFEEATGIQRTVSNDSKSFKTYNINGYEQNGQQRGLNIIRMSDGTVKKVIVK